MKVSEIEQQRASSTSVYHRGLGSSLHLNGYAGEALLGRCRVNRALSDVTTEKVGPPALARPPLSLIGLRSPRRYPNKSIQEQY
ncbi:hypothetical protein NPIL_190811 [Nephila pilipes]|uniref:Uncharacterized protein n=1 Tax=Nephila pilipes TaxID=299642 RepID=A0A8X6US74_NEPPI|nr:hypothetical protein NPIL_190811 [Nephila pilipes]